MTAKDYLTALKVIREIQRKQAYCSGASQPFLAETLKMNGQNYFSLLRK